jgi:Domain of unknown function (DUF4396)
MEATTHSHHQMPTSGGALSAVALSATLHCLTGCALGEVAGMALGTALGLSNFATIVLAIVLAFLFGYSLTSLPLLRAGLALGAVIPIALASDTLSIATMEVVDNAVLLLIPGAMHAGLGDLLFWGALSFALVVAGAFAFPVNRWLIARGKGHTAVHDTGIHGGPPVRVVGAVAALAGVFGTAVLALEAFSDEEASHDATERHAGAAAEHSARPDPVRGLAVSSDGMVLEIDRAELPRDGRTRFSFRIVASDGHPVRDFEVAHERRMHLIVARRDMTGFQHLHPRMAGNGTWSTPITLPTAGSYRVFADFKRKGKNQTLAADLGVDGPLEWQALPSQSATATTSTGYEVGLDGGETRVGREAELGFTVRRGGKPVQVERYLGAGGHLVALREGDLAYLHTHPSGHDGRARAGDHGNTVVFETAFPSAGSYRLFLQFKHRGNVHTAAFTKEVSRPR